MAKKVQNQFSPGLRMSYQKRAADDFKSTGADTSDIHKNRHISLYKNCTSRLHSDELRRASIHKSAAANYLWTIAIGQLRKSSIDFTRQLNPPLSSLDMTSLHTSGLRIVSDSLLVTHSQTRWKVILDFFGHHIFVFQLMCGIFPVFLGLFLFLLGHC